MNRHDLNPEKLIVPSEVTSTPLPNWRDKLYSGYDANASMRHKASLPAEELGVSDSSILKLALLARLEGRQEKGYASSLRASIGTEEPAREEILKTCLLYEMEHLDTLKNHSGNKFRDQITKALLSSADFDHFEHPQRSTSTKQDATLLNLMRARIDALDLKEIESWLIKDRTPARSDYFYRVLTNIAQERSGREPEAAEKILAKLGEVIFSDLKSRTLADGFTQLRAINPAVVERAVSDILKGSDQGLRENLHQDVLFILMERTKAESIDPARFAAINKFLNSVPSLERVVGNADQDARGQIEQQTVERQSRKLSDSLKTFAATCSDEVVAICQEGEGRVRSWLERKRGILNLWKIQPLNEQELRDFNYENASDNSRNVARISQSLLSAETHWSELVAQRSQGERESAAKTLHEVESLIKALSLDNLTQVQSLAISPKSIDLRHPSLLVLGEYSSLAVVGLTLKGEPTRFYPLEQLNSHIENELSIAGAEPRRVQKLGQGWQALSATLSEFSYSEYSRLSKDISISVVSGLLSSLQGDLPQRHQNLLKIMTQVDPNHQDWELLKEQLPDAELRLPHYKRVRAEVYEKLQEAEIRLHREVREYKSQAQLDALERAQVEHLQQEAQAKIAYLKNLFAMGTGIAADEMGTSASTSSGEHLGSIQFAHQTISLSQTQDLSLTPWSTAFTGIDLQIGEDLSSMLKRRSMIDWVGSHEFAHHVARHTGDDMSIEHARDTWEALSKKLETDLHSEFEETLSEQIAAQASELFIDGIGLQLASKFGVSDIAAQSEKDRVLTMANSFCCAANLVRESSVMQSEDSETRIGAGILLLRLEIVATALESKAEDLGLPSKDCECLSLQATQLSLQREELIPSSVISKEGIGQIKEMYSKAFQAGYDSEVYA